MLISRLKTKHKVQICIVIGVFCRVLLCFSVSIFFANESTDVVYAGQPIRASVVDSLSVSNASVSLTNNMNYMELDTLGKWVKPTYKSDSIVSIKEFKYKKGHTIKFSTNKDDLEEPIQITDTILNRNYKVQQVQGGVVYTIPETWRSEFKSYMAYTAVQSRDTPQYQMLYSNDAYTNEYGIRMYKGRYCVAVASGIARTIGTKLDIRLKNGTVLLCVLGDQKRDSETGTHHMYHEDGDGSVVEFIVDMSVFLQVKDASGTVNFVPGWSGKIDKIVVER